VVVHTKPTLARSEPMDACPVHALRKRLRSAQLRPTRQRVALGWLLFAKGNRHVTAEMLFDEAKAIRVPVSIATVYNTLHQFAEAGLVREIAVEGSKAFFDTNPRPHGHFLFEDSGSLVDIPTKLELAQPPQTPDGYEMGRLEVVIHLRRTGSTLVGEGQNAAGPGVLA